jgi:hypothetical protein
MDEETFLRAAGAFAVDWTVKFYEAPVDAVSHAYASFRNCIVARNVSIAASTPALPLRPPVGVIVRPANTDWTIVLHEWSRFPQFPILSGLSARTLELGGTDGSRAHTCNFVAPSKPIKVVRYRTRSVAAEEMETLDDSGRSQSSRKKFTVVDNYATVFEKYKIKLAFVCLDENRQMVFPVGSPADIARVDVAILP